MARGGARVRRGSGVEPPERSRALGLRGPRAWRTGGDDRYQAAHARRDASPRLPRAPRTTPCAAESRVTSPARTLVDLAHVLEHAELTRAVRQAQFQRLFDIPSLQRALARRPSSDPAQTDRRHRSHAVAPRGPPARHLRPPRHPAPAHPAAPPRPPRRLPLAGRAPRRRDRRLRGHGTRDAFQADRAHERAPACGLRGPALHATPTSRGAQAGSPRRSGRSCSARIAKPTLCVGIVNPRRSAARALRPAPRALRCRRAAASRRARVRPRVRWRAGRARW